jgi:hypothetical protein
VMQGVKDHFSRSQHAPELRKRGAKGIRTPDLLHAIQARAVAGWGRASACEPFTCGNPGPMWPDVARRLPTLAPDLAPRKLISSANVRQAEHAAGPLSPPKPAAMISPGQLCRAPPSSGPPARAHPSREGLSSAVICTLSSNKYLAEVLPYPLTTSMLPNANIDGQAPDVAL